MKLIKDLCIGDKIYKVTKEDIIDESICSITLTDSIYVNRDFTGTANSALLLGRYENKRFSNIKEAKIEQTKLRQEYFNKLLNDVKVANEKLANFVDKYSIIK